MEEEAGQLAADGVVGALNEASFHAPRVCAREATGTCRSYAAGLWNVTSVPGD